MERRVHVGLSAVILACDQTAPYVLATRQGEGRDGTGLPFGPFDPVGHRTFELGLREWVTAQTGFDLGYVEQLYTFGDQGRELPEASQVEEDGTRVVSVGYLALTPERTELGGFDAVWRDWYRYLPWEDHRRGVPALLTQEIPDALNAWADRGDTPVEQSVRRDRARLAFGLEGRAWIEERVLERYELLYEAGLVAEHKRDRPSRADPDLPDFGEAMVSDHRRILATAAGRIRGKIKYRPIVFELMSDTFTLSGLQNVVEALLGVSVHKQNFRRALERSRLVEGTGTFENATGGRPAELYRFRRDALREKVTLGIAAPASRGT